MQYTKVRDQQLNLAARRQEADSRSVASRRSDFKRKRKLSYNNVVEKKKKKNNRNNNNTNDEIAAVKVEIKKSTDALADLYSRCRNSKDAERLQFNPSLYGCFVDKYIEDKLKVGSTLRRIVEILLDNPRRSWKCIDTNSLIFNNDEVKWLNSSLNTKKNTCR